MATALRELFKRGLGGADAAGWLDAALAWRRRHGPPRVTILCYHRVHDPSAEQGELRQLCSATPAGFEAQMKVVAASYRTVTFAELESLLERGGTLPRDLAVLTFDDGYRDNVELALPILRRHGLRAVFYVVSGYPSGTVVSWIDRVAYAVSGAPAGALELPRLGTRLRLGAGDRHAAVDALVGSLKKVPWEQARRAVDELEERAGRALPEELWRRQAMSPGELRVLVEAGMEIGNHGRSHCALTQLGSDAELREEIGGGRAELEALAAAPVLSFAYPHGEGYFDARAVRVVEETGHRFAVDCRTGDHGANRLEGLDRFRLRRLAITSPTMPLAAFKARLAFADQIPLRIA